MIHKHEERLRSMIADNSQTWDLSENDKEAIKWALSWHDAVINSCIGSFLSWDEDGPRETLSDLIYWETMVALDPAVSADARKLIEQGRELERTAGLEPA